MIVRVAADVGSTWTRAAVCRDGRTQLLTLPGSAPGDDALRSVVVLEDGRPTASIDGVPMERSRVDDVVLRLGDPTPVPLDSVNVSATDLLAALLRPVVQMTHDVVRPGSPPAPLTLAVPAAWGEYRRQRVQEAAGLAGAPYVVLVTGAEAVATRYAHCNGVDDGGLIGVYDIGGRSFGCAVVQHEGSEFTVVGRPDGVERLGGDDLDTTLLRHLDARLLGAVYGTGDSATVAVALHRCREAREQLSHQESCRVVLPTLEGEREETITRTELADLSGPLIQVTVDAVRATLASAGVGPGELSALVLVGGVATTPFLPGVLSQQLGTVVDAASDPSAETVLAAAGRPDPSRPSSPSGPGVTLSASTGTPADVVKGPPRPAPAPSAPVGLLRRLGTGTTLAAGGAALVLALVAVVGVQALGSSPEPLSFRTSFEDSQPQPLPNARVTAKGVGEFCCGSGGMESIRGNDESAESHTGVGNLLYSGESDGSGPPSALNTLLMLPPGMVIGSDTTFSWWIKPEEGRGWLSTFVSLDLRLDDGTHLDDLGAQRTVGTETAPPAVASLLVAGKWQQIIVDVGDVAEGREVQAIMLRFDSMPVSGPFRGRIDDVALIG